MNDLLLAWDGAGEAWLEWLLDRSLVSAVTFVIVGAVVLALRGRVSAHLPSRLLLLPLIVLVLPLERVLPRSWPAPLPAVGAPLFDEAPPVSEAGTAVSAELSSLEFGQPAPPVHPASGPAPRQRASTVGAPAIALLAWALFVLLGAGRMLTRQRRTDRLLWRSSRAPDPRTARMFERVCRAQGLGAAVGLRTTTCLASPVATGVLRPVVYLPTGLAGQLSVAQLRFVMLHELEHVRRRDVLTEAFTRVLRFAWIFHPGVWAVSASLRRWREYACDEAALAHTGTQARTPIADALFTLIDSSNDTPAPAGAVVHLLSTREFMKNRLTRILDRSMLPRRRLSPSSAVAVALIAVGALTAARAQQAVPIAVAADAEQEPGLVPPPAATDDLDQVLAQATTWLLQSQQADGRWPIGPDPAGANQRDHNDLHVTGLAVRALLPGLGGARQREIAQAVDRGADFLQSQQRENGCFAGDEPLTVMYGHAQVIRALAAVQEVRPDPGRLTAIEAGVQYALWARNPYMGWRYLPRDGDNDSKITGLMLLALHDARQLGVEVDDGAVRSARELMVQLTDEDTGRTGFVRRGQTMSRFTTKSKDFPGELSEEPTALKLLVDLTFGDELPSSKTMRRAVGLLVEQPPEWSPSRGSIDYAYWNFGAHALAAVGGERAEVWRASLRSELVPHRIVEGGAAHWPAIDAWSHPGMEVYATASAMLALQALR